MIHFQHIWDGGFGILYEFDNIGEALMAHRHDPSTEHTVEVIFGYAVVEMLDGLMTAGATSTIRFDSSKMHVVRALEPGTVIINRFLHGEPNEYRLLPETERQGIIDPATYGRRAFLTPQKGSDNHE